MGPRAPFFMASFSPHRSATDQPTPYPLTSPLVCVARDVLRWGEDKVAAVLLLGVCCSVTPRGVCPVASLPQKQTEEEWQVDHACFPDAFWAEEEQGSISRIV